MNDQAAFPALIAFVTARVDEDEKFLASNEHHLWTQRPFREVEAKRRTIEAAVAAWNATADPDDTYWAGLAPTLKALVKNLAAIWCDHADYRADGSRAQPPGARRGMGASHCRHVRSIMSGPVPSGSARQPGVFSAPSAAYLQLILPAQTTFQRLPAPFRNFRAEPIPAARVAEFNNRTRQRR